MNRHSLNKTYSLIADHSLKVTLNVLCRAALVDVPECLNWCVLCGEGRRIDANAGATARAP